METIKEFWQSFRERKRYWMETIKELWQFLRERKKYWLAPVIIFLLLLGLIIAFGGSSAVAPFVYTIF